MIAFDETVCRNLNESASREWLETNGLGGYASSTISGMNARRYHGLLVAALRPPTHRFALLSKLEEAVFTDDARVEISTNSYAPGVTHPRGYERQTGFRLDPFPVATFCLGDETELEKTVFTVYGENTIVIRYRLLVNGSEQNTSNFTLELRPLVAFRDYHSMQHEHATSNLRVQSEPGTLRVSVATGDGPALLLHHDAGEVTTEAHWYKQFAYPEEAARGFNEHEDLFNPCTLRFPLRPNESVDIVACSVDEFTPPRTVADAASLEERERARRSLIHNQTETSDEDLRLLLTAADSFIVRRPLNNESGSENKSSLKQNKRHSIIAGYHWFTDWGRDAMIALPGLLLATKRFDIAEDVLATFAQYVRDGLIPNCFPDQNQPGSLPLYNTVDATLWFVNAAGELMRRTSEAFVREHLYPTLCEITNAHEHGTHFNIRLDANGLLRAGEHGIQLTWMDAKVGDYVVTPREGKPVEIQALWYNALRTVAEMSRRFGDERTERRCRELAEQAQSEFTRRFWNEDAGCLFDLLRDDDTPDAAIRPNQIFAVSLPFPILIDEDRARRALVVVERELLTPYGLRSLSPHDPSYRPHYTGDVWSRDTAYHQGTVWAWLIGAFITAYLKVNRRSEESLRQARAWLEPLRAHLREAGVGQISEIFDADPPHTPRGTVAQAWSVAEVLRCELEELV